jgi:hypothetical protein
MGIEKLVNNTSKYSSVQQNGIILENFHQKKSSTMVPITKLLRKTKVFEWIAECQTTLENIKNQYIQVPILINLN